MNKINFKGIFENFKHNLFNSKKYLIIVFIIIGISIFSNFNLSNYYSPKFEIIIILIISIFAILIISSFLNQYENNEIHKTVFFIILLFGILCCLLVPFASPDDEYEHFPRAEITSNGDFFPEYVNESYISIQSVYDLTNVGIERNDNFDIISIEKGTVFTSDVDSKPINYTIHNFHSVFAQNPFYGYLAQSFGIFLAKMFNLNAVWMLWLGRICNLILYACLVSLAVKKTPILKIPLIVMSCIPLAVFQASSLSIDALINGLSILIIALFFNYSKSEPNSLSKKDMIIFSILVLIVGTCKMSYFALIFLLLFIPMNNYKMEKYYYYNFILIIIISVIALLWMNFYADTGFQQSYRHLFWIERNINSTEQLKYLFTHKKESLITILHIPNYFDIDLVFNSKNLSFNSFNSLYLMFLGAVSLLYPHEKFTLKSRIGVIFVSMLIYYGTYLILLLTWTPIGQLDPINGVLPRYFLPLFIFIPFVFGFNHNFEKNKEIDMMLIVLVVGFLSSMIISMLGVYYG